MQKRTYRQSPDTFPMLLCSFVSQHPSKHGAGEVPYRVLFCWLTEAMASLFGRPCSPRHMGRLQKYKLKGSWEANPCYQSPSHWPRYPSQYHRSHCDSASQSCSVSYLDGASHLDLSAVFERGSVSPRFPALCRYRIALVLVSVWGWCGPHPRLSLSWRVMEDSRM